MASGTESGSVRLAGPGCAAHFIQEVSREGKANRKRQCCSTAFSLTLSLSLSIRSHSFAPSGTLPGRKGAGRGGSQSGGGASWLDNLLEVKKALTQDNIPMALEEGPVSHTALESSAACRRPRPRRCGCCVVMGENFDPGAMTM